MKIIHISDLHLGGEDEERFGENPFRRLKDCIEHVNAYHSDADLCVFTGDLSDSGDLPSYQRFRSAVASLTAPYRLLPGNHDLRANMVAALPEIQVDGSGFLQSFLDLQDARLLFLDTLNEGISAGEYCPIRTAWLNEKLAGADGRPCYMFMHHPPVAIGLPYLDPVALADADRFLDVPRRHGNVGHIFFGHVHRDVSGTVAGIPFLGQRGLHARFPLDFGAPRSVVEQAPPAYGVILIDAAHATVVAHSCDFREHWPQYFSKTGERLVTAVAAGQEAKDGFR
jgi:3',5'-cyclic AMP phosphodiesterase CpdA